MKIGGWDEFNSYGRGNQSRPHLHRLRRTKTHRRWSTRRLRAKSGGTHEWDIVADVVVADQSPIVATRCAAWVRLVDYEAEAVRCERAGHPPRAFTPGEQTPGFKKSSEPWLRIMTIMRQYPLQRPYRVEEALPVLLRSECRGPQETNVAQAPGKDVRKWKRVEFYDEMDHTIKKPAVVAETPGTDSKTNNIWVLPCGACTCGIGRARSGGLSCGVTDVTKPISAGPPLSRSWQPGLPLRSALGATGGGPGVPSAAKEVTSRG
jgi:hypothetical protein